MLYKRSLDLNIKNATSMQRQDISGLEGLLLTAGGQHLLSVPAKELKPFNQGQISQFCHEHGIYQIITDELIEFLGCEMAGASCVEIGAGNGAVARYLRNTVATDSYAQATPEMQLTYARMGVPTIKYGINVLKYEALAAVKEFRPEVVLGCWVTHKWESGEDGFADGVDEVAMMHPDLGVEKYLVVGNKKTHGAKPILKTKGFKPKQFTNLPWLYSRSMSPELNTIYKITRR